MSNKKNNLGRGLGALMGEIEEDSQEIDLTNKELKYIELSKLAPSPFQPRIEFDEEAISDLVGSIKEKGILQPLLVRVNPENPEMYEIIAGERRWRASQAAGIIEVPVIVKEFDNKEALEVALVENLQRQDLSPLEEADGYKRLIDEFGHTQDELAKAMGKSRSHVANMMRLLSLPDGVKEYVRQGALSAGHARALLNVDEPVLIAEEVVKKGLNVRQTEKLAKSSGIKVRKPSAPKAKKEKDDDTIALEENLTTAFGMKVEINSKGSAGVFSIHYSNLEELDLIIRKLGSVMLGAGNELPQETLEEPEIPDVIEEEIVDVAAEVSQEIVEEDDWAAGIDEKIGLGDGSEEDSLPEEAIVDDDAWASAISKDVEDVAPEKLENAENLEEISEEYEYVEEIVEVPQEGMEEDDWAAGIDEKVGLGDGSEEDSLPEEAIVDDDAWASAISPDVGEDASHNMEAVEEIVEEVFEGAVDSVGDVMEEIEETQFDEPEIETQAEEIVEKIDEIMENQPVEEIPEGVEPLEEFLNKEIQNESEINENGVNDFSEVAFDEVDGKQAQEEK